MGRPRGLTEKQARFVEEYMIDLDPQRAARVAGYSPHTTDRQAYQLLGNPWVQKAFQAKKAAQTERTGITADVILGELLRVARSDLSAVYDADGRLKSIHDIPEDARRAIAGIEVEEIYAGSGQKRKAIGQTRKLKLWDKTKALELLGKHLKLYTEIHSIPELEGLAGRLDAARKRARDR